LTFASRASGQVGSECQIRPTGVLVFTVIARSEATKQSATGGAELDCFAWLAMTFWKSRRHAHQN
jgi:hypothetical protein